MAEGKVWPERREQPQSPTANSLIDSVSANPGGWPPVPPIPPRPPLRRADELPVAGAGPCPRPRRPCRHGQSCCLVPSPPRRSAVLLLPSAGELVPSGGGSCLRGEHTGLLAACGAVAVATVRAGPAAEEGAVCPTEYGVVRHFVWNSMCLRSKMVVQKKQRKPGEVSWPKVVLKKWLNLKSKDSKFNADEEDEEEEGSDVDEQDAIEASRRSLEKLDGVREGLLLLLREVDGSVVADAEAAAAAPRRLLPTRGSFAIDVALRRAARTRADPVLRDADERGDRGGRLPGHRRSPLPPASTAAPPRAEAARCERPEQRASVRGR
ncbi:hypothetical protein ABZP36_012393 [Zizania latifolia]